MASNGEPLIVLDPGGKAPILSYNVPEPTSYSGQNFIELEFPYPPEEFFQPLAFEKPEKTRTPIENLDLPAAKTAVVTGMKAGFSDPKLFPNIRVNSGVLRFVEKSNPGFKLVSTMPISPQLAELEPEEVAAQMQAGKRLNIYTSIFGTLQHNYIPEPTEPSPGLYIVESYRLSSFLGSYGAGKILKTFTLLPGEKTKISIKTFTKTEQERKSASSILDSFTQESADDFETSVQTEQSDKKTYSKSFEYHAEAEAKASWGWGSAKVSGGVKGGTNSAREEFAKNVSSSTQKHSAKASAKRDIQINTSYEVTEETGEETSIERELENINLSRTLNFIFRQMNQEFITLLHLVDVRVAFFNGFAESRREVTLPELDSLLEEYVVEKRRNEVREKIIEALGTIFDYRGKPYNNFIEERVIDDEPGYLRVNTDLISAYKDEITGTEIFVPGIILTATKNVLRTEGVIVEALLGQGEALDNYATRLQELEVVRREAEVALESAEAEKARLLNDVIRENDEQRAKLITELTCSCKIQKSGLDINVHHKEMGEVES